MTPDNAAAVPSCPDLQWIDPSFVGLKLETRPLTESITQASTGTALLRVSNVGSKPFKITDVAVPIIGTLVDPGTLRVRGEYSGGVSGAGFATDLAPGQSAEIHVVFVATLCGGEWGSVPPGVYGLRVALTQETSASRVAYLADEVPVVITEATGAPVDPEHTMITDFITPPSS